MRKKSKYRPKPVYLNMVERVLEGVTPVAKHDNYLVELKMRNHAAMEDVTKGRGTIKHMDTLLAMNNITEALWMMGFGKGYEDRLRDGHRTLLEVCRRGVATGSFVLRGSEIEALNALMELHDAQMEVITVKDMENAITLAKKVIGAKKATTIIQKEPT